MSDDMSDDMSDRVPVVFFELDFKKLVIDGNVAPDIIR